MSWIFVLTVVLATIGVPLFLLFGGAAIALFMSLPEGAWASAAIDVFSANFAESPSLMTIPLFTFAGFMLAESRAPIRLIELSRAWLGWMPGGTAIVCLLVSTFFSTFTGGSGVTIVAVGGLLYPALIKEKYPDSFSIGLITTAGAMGGLFPPSVLLVFYGIIAGLIVDKVLVAGILAGFISTGALAAYCAYVGYKAGVPRQSFSFKEAWRTTWIAKWELAIPVVLLAGLALGLLRFHEASAFSAVYVLFIEVFIYRDIGIRKDLPRVIVDCMTMLGAVLAILITAIGFTGWMIQAEVPTQIFDFMDEHIKSQWAFLVALNVFLVVVGMVTDGVTAILVVVPLILPLGLAYGIDPYHLAIIFLLNLEMGFLIPPVGMNLFISSIRFGKSVTYVCRAVVPWLIILTIVLGVVTYVPWISTYLPSLIKVEGEMTNADRMENQQGNLVDVDDPMAMPADGGDFEDFLGGDDLLPLATDAGVDAAVDGGTAKVDAAAAAVVPAGEAPPAAPTVVAPAAVPAKAAAAPAAAAVPGTAE